MTISKPKTCPNPKLIRLSLGFEILTLMLGWSHTLDWLNQGVELHNF